MGEIPHIESGDRRMRWRPNTPRMASPSHPGYEDEAPATYADDEDHPPARLGRVLRFALSIFVLALIGSGSAVAWRTYFDPTNPVSDAMNPAMQPSGPINPAVQALQPNVENPQKIAEILAALQVEKNAILVLQAEKNAILTWAAAETKRAEQHSEQLTQLRNQIAGLQAEIAAVRELQTSQKTAKKQAARPRQPGDGDKAAADNKRRAPAGTPSSAPKPPAQATTRTPLALR